MIAIDLPVRILIFPLASEGPSTHGVEGEMKLAVRQVTVCADDG